MRYNIQYIKLDITNEEGKPLYRIMCNDIEIDVQPWRAIEEYYPEWSIKLQYDKIVQHLAKKNS